MTLRLLSVLLASLALAACNCGDDHNRDAGQDSGQGASETVAIDVPGLGDAGFNYTQGTYILGFAFRSPSAIKITQVGYYDSNLAGRAQTFAAHAIGVYDLNTNTLLGSATVQPTDPATGLFRYVALDGGITLNTTDTYAIVGVSGANFYTVGINASEATVNAITYLSGAGYSTTASNANPTQTSTLIQPNAFDVGNIFGQVPAAGTLCDFGANFKFLPAP